VSQDVVVGYLHGDNITQEFHHCLFGVFIHDMWGPQRIVNFAPQYSNVNVCRSRNQMVTDFLAQERAEWLWLLDVDAAFPPDMLDRMLTVADKKKRPVIGALAHQRRGKTDENGPVFDAFGSQDIEIVPTMYQLAWDANGEYEGYREVERYELGLNEVDATGAHCLLVHRSVFEAIKSDHPYRWFREDEWTPGGPVVGEDLWFCLKAREAGFPIFVDTRLESGHIKRFCITSAMSHVERLI
jgi:hypothetical protein